MSQLQSTVVSKSVGFGLFRNEVKTEEFIFPLAFVIDVQVKRTVTVLNGFASQSDGIFRLKFYRFHG